MFDNTRRILSCIHVYGRGSYTEEMSHEAVLKKRSVESRPGQVSFLFAMIKNIYIIKKKSKYNTIIYDKKIYKRDYNLFTFLHPCFGPVLALTFLLD